MRFVIDARYAGPRPSGIATYLRAVGSRVVARPDTADHAFRFWVPPSAAPIASGPRVTHHTVSSPKASLGTLLWPSRYDSTLSDDDVFHAPANIMGFNLPRRTIVTLHDVIWLEHPEWCQPVRALLPISRRYFAAGIGHAMRAAQQLITVSSAAADTILRHAPDAKSRLVVIPLAPDADFVPPVSRSDAAAWAAKKLGFSEPYFLVVGQNQPSKGHDHALAAFAAAGLPHHRLVFVQRLRTGGKLQDSARQLGIEPRVHFIGEQSRTDLVSLLQAATALLQPSLAEGFGLPVLEAIACGCPVIASDIPPLREILGAAGSFAPAGTSRELGVAIRRIATEPALAEELRGLGLKRAPTFSWERTAEATWQVYRHVAQT